MKRIIMMLLVLAVVGGTTEVNAQSWLKKLGEKATEAAKRKVEQKVEEKTEKAVDDVFEGNIGKGKKNKKDKNNNAADNGGEVYDDGAVATAQSGGTQQKSVQMSWNKFDFVSGDEIMFEDNQANEQLGEFPSMWDMVKGNVEIAQLDGENVIALRKTAGITPLMKEGKNYLPEEYTIEFDFYKGGEAGDENDPMYISGIYDFFIYDSNGKQVVKMSTWGYRSTKSYGSELDTDLYSTSGEKRQVKETVSYVRGWNRISISFNKRALKVYVNETRIVNAPNVAQGGYFAINSNTNGDYTFYIRNVRIAKGAVPLYDRMMSDGKFITYGITFDVGKSTIKPESMGEINRIVQLMNENPDLKFSVEGHTDSTGNAASNQTLSEARSQAIVAKLVEMGIAANRLTAVGKGQNNPIADNGTDEGRAKNRRVEFVKM